MLPGKPSVECRTTEARMKDLKTQMRAAVDGALDVLADRHQIPAAVELDGVRLGPSHYAIELQHIEPNLLIPRDEGDSILPAHNDARLQQILTDHVRFAGRVGRQGSPTSAGTAHSIRPETERAPRPSPIPAAGSSGSHAPAGPTGRRRRSSRPWRLRRSPTGALPGR